MIIGGGVKISEIGQPVVVKPGGPHRDRGVHEEPDYARLKMTAESGSSGSNSWKFSQRTAVLLPYTRGEKQPGRVGCWLFARECDRYNPGIQFSNLRKPFPEGSITVLCRGRSEHGAKGRRQMDEWSADRASMLAPPTGMRPRYSATPLRRCGGGIYGWWFSFVCNGRFVRPWPSMRRRINVDGRYVDCWAAVDVRAH